jgi:hypothetical protein
MKQLQTKTKIMKTLTKLALAAVLLTTAAAAHAETVRGHFRSNGTYVAPYYRTPANGTPYDNLSYRGYPSQQPGYISSRKSGLDSSFTLPSYDFSIPSRRSFSKCFDSGLQTMPKLDGSQKIHAYGF